MRLPDFPWDHLVSFKEKARAHPYGLVDLSVGTPVDATPQVVRQALAGAADAPGYPLTAGTPELGEAAAGWLARRLGVVVEPSAVLPVLGTKELVAQLPSQLGLEPGDRVWVPTPAYPTYEVGALLARCEPVVGPAEGVTLVWLNTPGNPTGRVLSVDEMRAVVHWARERGVIVASDECYIELGWEARAVSVLHPDVCGGSHEGLLAVHSLSKRSNLAGYRAGFVTGDPEIVAGLLQLRKHAGMMMPAPVQAAMTAALADDMHVADQRARYANRRAVLAAALAVAGFTIEHSEAGLYLWATRGEDCWATVDALASVGVLVAPGSFYGESGRRHIRVALTAPDSQIATVPERMTMLPPVGGQPAQYGPGAGWAAQTPPGGYRHHQQQARPDNYGAGEQYGQSGYRDGRGGPAADPYRQAPAPEHPVDRRPPAPYQTGQTPLPSYQTAQPPPYQTGQTPVPPPYQTGQTPVPQAYETGQTPVPPYQTGQVPLPPYQTGQTVLPRSYPPGPEEHSAHGQPGAETAEHNGSRHWRAEPDIR
ncbi:succinyldiaminopimelate aminotransferase apoenzyme [Frankia sp. EI5c]|uniref:succinyldiaminopimelate transaminase n=1 Tax=Frankia sp. EI5c TaxID=683316 RepID=UPI0007C2B561|nr:succinyldiaminopimelate transaminase [Frankia sp. EI5c]OAA24184.1 succinyldiaminopimelate aminotransferase apoenzyme [Frankia sp. EI5c]